MTKIGVTGTRNPLTEFQLQSAYDFLSGIIDDKKELHHGDCIGADYTIAMMAHKLGFLIVCHPPISYALRGFAIYDQVRPALTYFERNRNIVDETDLLLVFPMQMTHQAKGGTWYTYDYAIKAGKPVKMFYPKKIEC